MSKQFEKLKIHMPGLPHTITTRDDPRFMTCAFTTKIYLLSKKFHDMGHEVVHYGVEGSDVPCTENVEYIPFDMWNKCHGQRNEEGWQEFGPNYETFKHAEKTLYKEINSRITDPSREVVLAPFGSWAPTLTKINKAALIESGIGYNGVFADYRCFESYAWQHTHLGIGDPVSDPKWFHSVIPGYVDPSEFSYSEEKDDYLLFIGRIMDTKGIYLAEQLAREYNKKLIVAGNGETSWLKNLKHVEYVGVVGVEEKRELYKNAAATVCLTQYTEPFGNVHVESMISGTPVITTDWGVYTETVPQGKVGWRGRTWEDHKYGVENLGKIDPQICRDWAMSNFSLDAVYPAFNQYFEKCAAHFSYLHNTGKSSWYFERDNYEDFVWNYERNYSEFTKTHVVMICNDPFAKMALKSLESFASYHSNYDFTIINCGLSEDNKEKFSKLREFVKFIDVDDSFFSVEKKHVSDISLNPTWLKFLKFNELPNSGTLLILDADTLFKNNIDEFLQFNDLELIHVCDDFASFKRQNDTNVEWGHGDTYFKDEYTSIFTDYREYENAVTFNAGVVALNLNHTKISILKERLHDLSKNLHTKITSWPMEQGILNHVLYSDGYINTDLVKVFNYVYNTSAYNKGILRERNIKSLKLLHYHSEETFNQFENLFGD